MSNYQVGGYDLEDIQHVMLVMMKDIDRVCQENSIRYILDGGTMLGAVRHKNFIPWDDDLDIAMPRDDYDKFISIANTELAPEYKFECMENTQEYPYNFGKVRAVNTLYVEEFTERLNINHGIYIDVFPMDYVDVNNQNKLAFVQRNIGHLTQLKYAKLHLRNKIKYMPFMILPLNAYNRMLRRLMTYSLKKKTIYVQKLCHFGKNKPPISIDMFDNTIRMPFGEHEFPVPQQYDSFLTDRYGDYMQLPPVESQQPCHVIKKVEI
ncbi:MAG: LicD family protein [Oscillospiraceae bacterium]|nr:LicD family protein [Oscillospiraceae bacterium]